MDDVTLKTDSDGDENGQYPDGLDPSKPDVGLNERYKMAAERGLVILLPAGNEIFLDLDSHEAHDEACGLIELAKKCGLPITGTYVAPSQTPGHVHMIVTFDLTDAIFDNFDDMPELRIGLQAAFGSDRKREVMSYARVFQSIPDPTCLFATTAQADRWGRSGLTANGRADSPVVDLDDDIPF